MLRGLDLGSKLNWICGTSTRRPRRGRTDASLVEGAAAIAFATRGRSRPETLNRSRRQDERARAALSLVECGCVRAAATIASTRPGITHSSVQGGTMAQKVDQAANL